MGEEGLTDLAPSCPGVRMSSRDVVPAELSR